jgi:hypothetical protein
MPTNVKDVLALLSVLGTVAEGLHLGDAWKRIDEAFRSEHLNTDPLPEDPSAALKAEYDEKIRQKFGET